MAARVSAATSGRRSDGRSFWRSVDDSRGLGTGPVIRRSKSRRLVPRRNGQWVRQMRKKILMLAAAALAFAPAAAQQQRYLDPRDVAEAQRDNAELVQALGGA